MADGKSSSPELFLIGRQSDRGRRPAGQSVHRLDKQISFTPGSLLGPLGIFAVENKANGGLSPRRVPFFRSSVCTAWNLQPYGNYEVWTRPAHQDWGCRPYLCITICPPVHSLVLDVKFQGDIGRSQTRAKTPLKYPSTCALSDIENKVPVCRAISRSKMISPFSARLHTVFLQRCKHGRGSCQIWHFLPPNRKLPLPVPPGMCP